MLLGCEGGRLFFRGFLLQCAVVLFFLGGAFYLRIASDRQKDVSDVLIASGPVATFSAQVDVNRASHQELETLPGIGKVLSMKIVQYRREHGLYQKPSDLLNIKGIGPKTLERISPYLVFKTATSKNMPE